MNKIEDLSISVVTMNNREINRNCLKSIFDHTRGISFKVFVLDNNSSDGTVEMIRKEFPQVELIESKVVRGFTANQNTILRRVKSKYVLLLNNDTIFVDNSLKKMIDFLNINPHVGAVACKILNADGSFQSTCIRCDLDLLSMFAIKTGLERLFPKSKIWGRPHMGYANRDKEQEIEVYSGACVMIRSKVFDEIGFLDENISLGPDDYDFSLRLRKQGWKIYYLPAARVIHLHGQTKKSNPDNYLEEYKGVFYLYLKHYGKFKTIILKIIMLYGSFSKSIYLLHSFIRNKIKKKELMESFRLLGRINKLVISYSLKDTGFY